MPMYIMYTPTLVYAIIFYWEEELQITDYSYILIDR